MHPAPGLRHVFLHQFTLPARIGFYAQEMQGPQRIVIDLDLLVADTGEEARRTDELLEEVVDYGGLVAHVRERVALRHYKLVETLAETIAATCLAADKRIHSIQVRVAKPDIFPDIAAAGVCILRHAAK